MRRRKSSAPSAKEKAEYVITLRRGQPVAVLRPIEPVTKDAEEILLLAARRLLGLDETELAEVEAAIQRRPDFFGEHAVAGQ